MFPSKLKWIQWTYWTKNIFTGIYVTNNPARCVINWMTFVVSMDGVTQACVCDSQLSMDGAAGIWDVLTGADCT